MNSDVSIDSSRPRRRPALLALAVAAALPAVAASVVLLHATLSDTPLPGEVDALWRFAVVAAAVAFLGGVSAWLAARLVSQAGPWSAAAWLWSLAGSGLAALVEASLRLSTIAEFGHFDPEFVGVSLALPWVVAALTIVVVVRSTSLGRARYVSSIVLLVTAAVCVWLTVVSFPAALDELTPHRWQLPIARAGAAIYAVAAVASVFGSKRRAFSST